MTKEERKLSRVLDYLEAEIWSHKLPCGVMFVVEDRERLSSLCRAFGIVAEAREKASHTVPTP